MQTLTDGAIYFSEKILQSMTNTVNQWLMTAVSVPQTHYAERYYYDAQENELFSISESDLILLKVSDNTYEPLSNKSIDSLSEKISRITSKSGIIEIPRLSLEQRRAIQTDFIYNIENFNFFDDFLTAINNQDQSHSFVIDHLFISNKKAYNFIDYWAEFKTQQLAYFINDLEDTYDISFNEVRLLLL